MREITFTVERDGVIKDYLRRSCGLSGTLIKRVKHGGVLVGGVCVGMRATVRAGDTVTVRLPEEEGGHVAPCPCPLRVLYEDEDVLAVDKGRDMPVHPSRGNHLPTLAEAVVAYNRGTYPPRAIGRLDRDTSGIVLFAKHALAAYRLCESMKAGAITRIYEALVTGTPTPMSGRIDAPIARACEGELRRVVREDGKPSVTLYRVQETNGERSLVRLELLTGRTHQIRVHMAHIGHPLCNDFLYGTAAPNASYLLHATELSFPHPMRDERLTVRSPAPFSLAP